MQAFYHKLAKICLGFILLIIIAGSVVRITGSGMGCPDWPKCFGYYIPPTDTSEIEFKPNHNYKKGEVILIKEVFHYAKKDFKSNSTLNVTNWQENTTHTYNTFNATHTWIEFINRLVTAVAGVPVLLLFIVSFRLFNTKRSLFFISGAVIVLMGIAAWLGKTVVDSNLMPTKISAHLALAYALVLTLTLGIFKSRPKKTSKINVSSLLKKMLCLTFVLTIIQIVLGIQVRQFVDGKIDTFGYQQHTWLQNPDWSFYVHRSFSIVLLISIVWLLLQNRKKDYHIKLINIVFGFLCFEVILGIIMSNFNFPFLSQPLHLVSSAILLALQFYILLKLFFTKHSTL